MKPRANENGPIVPQGAAAAGVSGASSAARADETRRGLLVKLARGAGLLLLGACSGWLLLRRSGGEGRAGPGGGTNPCAGCASLFSCLLPQAEQSRRQGIGLTGPVRRPVSGAKVEAGDIGCAEGRQALGESTSEVRR